MNRERRIPPFAEDTLVLLTDAIDETGEGLPRETAINVITTDERFDTVDAEEALDLLQSRGYIYYVDEYVRITPTD